MEHLGLDPTDPLPPQDSLEQAGSGAQRCELVDT